MQKENPLDRLGRVIRKPFIWALWVSGPIAVYTYGKAMVAYLWTLPVWIAVIVGLSQIAALAAVGFLFDIQQERRSSSERGPAVQPRQTR